MDFNIPTFLGFWHDSQGENVFNQLSASGYYYSLNTELINTETILAYI
jgi:hypothetical protein